jgi:uncharacterized protein (DUF3084 family)
MNHEDFRAYRSAYDPADDSPTQAQIEDLEEELREMREERDDAREERDEAREELAKGRAVVGEFLAWMEGR